jgi:hypothetical protein
VLVQIDADDLFSKLGIGRHSASVLLRLCPIHQISFEIWISYRSISVQIRIASIDGKPLFPLLENLADSRSFDIKHCGNVALLLPGMCSSTLAPEGVPPLEVVVSTLVIDMRSSASEVEQDCDAWRESIELSAELKDESPVLCREKPERTEDCDETARLCWLEEEVKESEAMEPFGEAERIAAPFLVVPLDSCRPGKWE